MNNSKPNTDRQGLAIILVVTTAFAISFADVFVKTISANMVIWQIFVLRSLIVVPVLITLCRLRANPISLVPNNVTWTLIRTL